MHPAHVAPCKDLVLGKRRRIFHYLFVLCAFLFIDKVGDQHIQRLPRTNDLPQRIQDLFVCLCVYPVIAVNNFEKQPACIFNACVDSLPMPAVFLMDRFYDIRISFFVSVRDLRRHIL